MPRRPTPRLLHAAPSGARPASGSSRAVLRGWSTAVLLWIGVACSNPQETPVADATLQELSADNVIYGMASYLTANGVREGRIEADTAYMYVDSAHIDLRGLSIVFYDEDGRERATVTGRSGEWDQQRDIMVARGDVLLVVHADDREIRTEELHYDAYGERIWSDTTTTQTLPDGTVTRGSSFESDLGFRNLRIENVRGGARAGP